jgi:LETM1 and EF-hand domain-containing protein 1
MVVEKEEIKELKEEMAEYQEDIKELYQIKAEAKGQADIENIKISKGAKRLFNKVNKMISKMDAVLTELEQSEKEVKERLKSLGPDEKENNKDIEELIKIDELVAAIKQIQNVPDEHRLKRIAEILGKIDDDHDGAIKIEDVLKVGTDYQFLLILCGIVYSCICVWAYNINIQLSHLIMIGLYSHHIFLIIFDLY